MLEAGCTGCPVPGWAACCCCLCWRHTVGGLLILLRDGWHCVSHIGAFGLISFSNLSRHFAVCFDAIAKHAEQPGVLRCCWMRDVVMYRRLLLAIEASTASPLRFQGTPMNVVNASRSRAACPSFVAETTAQTRSLQLFR